MITRLILEQGGEAAGSMEFVKTSIGEAIEFCEDRNFDVISEIPNFESNYKSASDKAKKGWTKRKDMPVIDTEDVQKFQARLEKGFIDIEKPFAKDTMPQKPFPEGLSGFNAQKFLKNGLKDGEISDDKIDVHIVNIQAGKLLPIQKQIYYDKSMGAIIEHGIKNTINFLTKKSFFIISYDNYIIDGHHRFLSAMLIDPNMTINALKIQLPINKLLPLSLAYGDAIGNKRNQ